MENVIRKIKETNTLERVKTHGLHFYSPVDDPLAGICLGDGKMGCLIWPGKDKLSIAVNHTDLWDLADTTEIKNWDLSEEENSNSLNHAGRLEIRFPSPVFENIYQKDYEADLSLENATYSLKSETPFSKISASAYSDSESGVTVLKLNGLFEEETGIDINLKNWGSRTFAHWYAQIRRNIDKGLNGTSAKANDKGIYLLRKFSNKFFCVGVYIDSESETNNTVINSHFAQSKIKPEKEISFTLYLTVAIESSAESAFETAYIRICRAAENESSIHSRHIAYWKSFWEKTDIKIDNSYYEALWYLNAYYGNSEMHGEYPPHFCNGIWGFNHDFVPWGHFFHWNMQLQYWAHLASGHTELMKPYLLFRYRQLPSAMRFAKKYYGVEGALYTDVTGANAVCDENTVKNLTPCAQISHDFWNFYLYSGDKEFLFNYGFPVIYQSALFYTNMVKKGKDGYYHIYKSQAYESSPIMDDVIVDHSAIRVLLKVAEDCITLMAKENRLEKEYDKREEWALIRENLCSIRLIPMEDDEYKVIDGEMFIDRGWAKGTKIDNNLVPVTGVFCGEERKPDEAELEDSEYWSTVKKGDLIRSSFLTDKRKPYYGMPDPEYSAVYPNPCVGLKDRDSDLFKGMVNLMRLKRPFVITDTEQVTYNEKEDYAAMGWSLDAIVLARLGMAERLEQRLNESIMAWQVYPNGLGHYGGYSMLKESFLRFYYNKVKDCDSPDNKIPFPAWEFRHFDLEMLPVTAMAINEMLLQSYEGRIRLFPVCKNNFSGSFKLYAANGALVYSKMTNGIVDYIYLEIKRSGNIDIVNPWECDSADIYSANGIKKTVPANNKDCSDRLIKLNVTENEAFLILPENTKPEDVNLRNDNIETPKVLRMGKARLGIEKMF